jgi:hypothetical protein
LNVARCQNTEFIVLSIITSYDLNKFPVKIPHRYLVTIAHLKFWGYGAFHSTLIIVKEIMSARSHGTCPNKIISVRFRDLAQVLTFKNRKRPIHELQFSPNGEMLAVGCNDGTIDICHTSQRFKLIGSCDVGKDHVTHCDWSADGKLLMADTGAGRQCFFKISGTIKSTASRPTPPRKLYFMFL